MERTSAGRTGTSFIPVFYHPAVPHSTRLNAYSDPAILKKPIGFDVPATIRSIWIKDKVIAVGWYIYQQIEPATEPAKEPDGSTPPPRIWGADLWNINIWGHDVAGIMAYKGTKETDPYEYFAKMLERQEGYYKGYCSTLTVSSRRNSPFFVGNMGGHGVDILRALDSDDKIKAWSDGTMMVTVGPDQQVGGKKWKNVKDLDGNTGWIASDYLIGTKR